jgi:hypothetical protein
MTGYPQKYMKTMEDAVSERAFECKNAQGKGKGRILKSKEATPEKRFCSCLLLFKYEGDSEDMYENKGKGKAGVRGKSEVQSPRSDVRSP